MDPSSTMPFAVFVHRDLCCELAQPFLICVCGPSRCPALLSELADTVREYRPTPPRYEGHPDRPDAASRRRRSSPGTTSGASVRGEPERPRRLVLMRLHASEEPENQTAA
jgi:hypothetical protein